MLDQDQLASFSILDITGSVGLTTIVEQSIDQSNEPIDENISLKRSYTVNGKASTTFGASDLVKVTINFSMKSKALDGCYQVSDYLPSGLKVINAVGSRGTDTNIWYPYEVANQRVSFCVTKESKGPITYYARVSGRGEYVGDRALMQSMRSRGSYTLTDKQTITVK